MPRSYLGSVEPSKTSMKIPGSAVPESVTLLVANAVPLAGAVITGAAGGVMSTVHVRLAGV